jgi:nitrite reductase (NADH) small subunit
MQRVCVATTDELRDSGKKIVTVKGMEIGVFALEDQYYAWRNVCPHAGAPMCEGSIGGTTLPSNVYEYELGCEGEILRCPWHGWEFNLKTGRFLVQPDIKLRGFPVEEDNGYLYLLM